MRFALLISMLMTSFSVHAQPSAYSSLKNAKAVSFDPIELGSLLLQSGGGGGFSAGARFGLTKNFGAPSGYGKPTDELSCVFQVSWLRGSDVDAIFKRSPGGLIVSTDPRVSFAPQFQETSLGGGFECKTWEESVNDQNWIEKECVEYDLSRPLPPVALALNVMLLQRDAGAVHISCSRKVRSNSDGISMSEFDQAIGKHMKFLF